MHVDDEYARKFMAGEGEVLFFDKKTSPRWFRAVLLAASTAGFGVFTAAMLASPQPQMALLAVPAVLAAALGNVMFWTLRTAVTQRCVHIQYGVFGPKIAVDAVQSVDVVDYDWKKFGGFGIRRALDGTVAYNMLGDQGRAVKVVYVDKGKARTVLISADHPHDVRDAIEAARTGKAVRTLDDARADAGLATAPSSDVLGDGAANVATSVGADARVDVEAKR